MENTPPLLTVEEAAAQAAADPQVGRGRGRGQPGPQMDFAADDKRQKQTARVMITLVSDLNAENRGDSRTPVCRPETVRVQCATCHRGVPNPQLSAI